MSHGTVHMSDWFIRCFSTECFEGDQEENNETLGFKLPLPDLSRTPAEPEGVLFLPMGDDPDLPPPRPPPRRDFWDTSDTGTMQAFAEGLQTQARQRVASAMALQDGFQEFESSSDWLRVLECKDMSHGHNAYVVSGLIAGVGPQELMALFSTSEMKQVQLFDQACARITSLESLQLPAPINGKLECVYKCQKPYMKGLVDRREFVTTQVEWNAEDGALWSAASFTSHPRQPASKSIKRAKVLLTSSRMERCDEGTQWTLLMCVDLKLPSAIYENGMGLPKELEKIFKHMRDHFGP